jgi:hypothetical protein
MAINHAQRHPKLWFAYFVLSVVLFTLNVVSSVVTMLEPGGAGRLFGVLLGLVSLWPLYGFVRQRRYSPRWLWQVFLVISSCGLVAVVAICLYLALTKLVATPIIIAAAFVALGGPYVFALQQYLYRSPHLWQHET